MVILAHRRPDRLLREKGLFEELCPGIWVRRPLEMSAIYFVAATHLPTDSEFDWLRMSTRLPESEEEIRRVESLLTGRKIDRITRAEVEETMFELMINGKTPKEVMAELAKGQIERRILEEKLEMETRMREELSLELAEMKRQMAELKSSE